MSVFSIFPFQYTKLFHFPEVRYIVATFLFLLHLFISSPFLHLQLRDDLILAAIMCLSMLESVVCAARVLCTLVVERCGVNLVVGSWVADVGVLAVGYGLRSLSQWI